MKKDPCKPFACKIQKCLHENNYQEGACQEFIELLRDCCRKWSTQSISCSGIDISQPPQKIIVMMLVNAKNLLII
ncbi:Cx9C motif-containing protein 4 [Blattella germanica]|nr:Cx9C motif-containing protein 4 [Blattella germanica]